MTQAFRLRGIHVAVIVIVFFAAVMAINAYFVSKALGTFPGEDEPKSFAQGLRYNDTLRDRARQSALGWRAEADLAPTHEGARVEVRIYAQSGASLTGLEVDGVLRRPADAKGDVALTFRRVGDSYVAEAPNLAAGHWDLRARAAEGDRRLDFGKVLLWRP